MARGMTPGESLLPIMVWVLPLLVCPYAKTVPARGVHAGSASVAEGRPAARQLSGRHSPWMPSIVAVTTPLAIESYTSCVVDLTLNRLSAAQWGARSDRRSRAREKRDSAREEREERRWAAHRS